MNCLLKPPLTSSLNDFDRHLVTLRHTRYQAAVIRDGCVLLVQCAFRDGSKWWMLPGGGREDEDETTCVAREVLEECGVIVHVDCLLSDVAADPPDGTYVRWRTYRCTVVSGEPKAGGGEGSNAELIAVRWLPLESAVWSDDITTDRFLCPQLLALRASDTSLFDTNRHPLLEDFNLRRRGAELPFVLDDDVEVLEGIYRGKRGTVDLLAYAETPLKYLVDFGDGTDELFPASALKLVRVGAA